jgi:hypothetical protein
MSRYAYFVNIFGEEFPKIKKFFGCYDSAYDFAVKHIYSHLTQLHKQENPLNIYKLFDNSFHIFCIDKQKCPNYKKLFLENSLPLTEKRRHRENWKKPNASENRTSYPHKDDKREQSPGTLGLEGEKTLKTKASDKSKFEESWCFPEFAVPN